MRKIAIITSLCTLCVYGMQSGIYKIDDFPDEVLLKKSFLPFDEKDRNVKKQYQVTYENMIAKEMKAKYAVVARNTKDEMSSKSVNRVILLNTAYSNHSKNVTYSDNLTRKYAELSFSVDSVTYAKRKYWYLSYGKSGFYGYGYDLDRFAPSEYRERYENNKSYTTLYDNDTFYSSKNLFILKSNRVKSFMLSSKWEESNATFFGSRLKEATYKIIQQTATFKLKTQRNYIDVLPIQKKISFIQANGKLTLNSGDFLAVSKADEEWYYGDFVYPDGSFVSGKIYADDLLDGKTDIQKIKNYKLKIFHSLLDDKGGLPNGAVSEVYTIRIYDKDNKQTQVIQAPGFSSSENGSVHIVDANFDGYDDLMIYSHDGGAGPNDGYNFYVYNVKNKKFEYCETLSNLTQTQIDYKRKVITSGWRNGAAEHGSQEYKWVNGSPVMTKEIVETYMDTDSIRTVTCTPKKGGKLKCKTKFTKDVQ